MAHDLVGFSRAGDEFHYRWAARRCLKIVYPNSTLTLVIIEGSKEVNTAGEYVIDISEYFDEDGQERIEYYQLKHTTVQKDSFFVISDLKDTLVGFSKRFKEHYDRNEILLGKINFNIVTNREFHPNFKKNLYGVANEKKVEKRFKSTLEKYTGLQPNELKAFCSLIKIDDSQGDYQVQKQELRVELAQIIACSDHNTQIENITALVKDRVLPNSDGKIVKEDVLMRFGVSSERELYPAEPIWEMAGKTIQRAHYKNLSEKIVASKNSVIVYAAGGVGKSVFTRQFINVLPEGSLGIAYDCFGAGKYRNRSETRHRHRDAFVQIVNELATKGLCDPMLVSANLSLETEITKMFLIKLASAVQSLKAAYENATLTILIDAADNAEMAAKEFNQPCFAHELLKEKMPDGCKLVLLCRPERVHLLQPPSFIEQWELELFTEEESFENLKNHFPDSNKQNGLEFHRLTNKNPRVQANALDLNAQTVEELLAKLGPAGITVEDQIGHQLQVSVSRLKDLLPNEFQSHIDSICMGLASLSPNIPIDVLAKAANVPVDSVKSFISDIGRSLWMSDSSVQFRDEPTETWFREKFCATKTAYENYITTLEPLTQHSVYVSEILPQLYLQAEQYEKLIAIALSDDFLPHDNPIDARNVRVYRLQFAFKAALKSKNYSDAIKLAMRAGEEVAGDQRQLGLLKQNIDLLVLLQSKEKIQNIAFRRLLYGKWLGSENIYSASLLSSFPEFHGEARGFLRAALNWLHIYFSESKKEEEQHREERLSDSDILEIARTKLNLDGVKECLEFLFSLKPKQAMARIIGDLTTGLIDIGSFETVDQLLLSCKMEPYFTIAITAKLYSVGRFPTLESIETCLILLCHSRSRIKESDGTWNKSINEKLLAFLEACIYRKLSTQKILRVSRHYFSKTAARRVIDSHFSSEREIFLRALAIRTYLNGKTSIHIEEILPADLKNEKDGYEKTQKKTEFTQLIEGLLPWYLARIEVLSTNGNPLGDNLSAISERSGKALSGRYKTYDPVPLEIAQLQLSILTLSNKSSNEQAKEFFTTYLKESKQLRIHDWLSAVRVAYRLPHLKAISREIENYTYSLINKQNEDGPDEISERFILLARAILINSKDDASVYFDDAIRIVSKFGDEIIQRWDAIVAVAIRACEGIHAPLNELSYRFIRVAEVVGEQLREKHWDRAEAIQISTRLSTGTGISTLSRWHDREIGRFEWLHYPLFLELINSKKISALTAWSLAPFCELEQFKYFLKGCLQSPSINQKSKSVIFEDALDRVVLENTNINYWYELDDLASLWGIKSKTLTSIILNLGSRKQEEAASLISQEYSPDALWSDIFDGHDVLTTKGLSDSYKKFTNQAQEKNQHPPRSTFWKGMISQLEEKDVLIYFETLQLSEIVDQYDFEEIFRQLPSEWLTRPSFKKKYQSIVTRIGSRFANTMTNSYSLDSFIKALPAHEQNRVFLSDGIIDGLAEGNDFVDAEIFFGFIKIVSDLITQNEAVSLLDYSLSRFEIHINNDFGDGHWSLWLEVTDDVNNNVAGYLWSALGSPRSATRWRATHSVLKLAKFNCPEVMECLFSWLRQDKVGAFGSKEYPFYSLHAKQYLLIALSRISISNAEFVRNYSKLFSDYAFFEKHILIQTAAANAAINIEATFPGTYEHTTLSELKKVGKSIQETKADYNYVTNSYWHAKGEAEEDIDFHFGWDFERYWFEPLARLFCIPGKQVQDLAANIVVNEWKITTNGYSKDPRVGIWNRSSREDNIHHDHGSYPKVDNLDFYLSYHAMMVVAATLIEKMPTVSREEGYEDSWGSWLIEHFITIPDGKWISEYRDPLPFQRPNWVYEEITDNWDAELEIQNFVDCIMPDGNEKKWLNVRGGWKEIKDAYQESYYINSALVSPETADALLNALATCKDPHDFKLPSYEEYRMEIDSPPFVLKGWIHEIDVTKGLDRFDPFASELTFPPYIIGKDIMDKLGLYTFDDNKTIFAPISSEPVLHSETWTSQRETRDEEPEQSGLRLRCSLDFIKYLCKHLQCELILEVQIRRKRHSRYDSYDKDGYKPPIHKMFIISEDGKLRGTAGSF